ncbi:DoxX family protein [Jannaschia ovalis]|uniref:DoxX family membrane protein n=1 Tax=Jannaschia ovalis TaxID=3038773 RepID=A0ABY8LFH9_9RHOB|nr:DoxX family membrane protein [Jannaschia sp. GRR-S6-38]WGH79158.1 DoxX family membrane protein [Jannaschia sp. GRR-S6-38]
MAVIDTVADYSQRIPTIRGSDWFLRVPLAAIIIEQGSFKLPDMAGQAESYGLPLILFALAAFAEIAGGIAILLGGLIRNNWMSDMLTRLGGLAITTVVAGVIVMIYFGPFSGWQLQGMLLAAGAFFLMRGNGDVKGRSLI